MSQIFNNEDSKGHSGFDIIPGRDGLVKVKMTVTPEFAERLAPFLRQKGVQADDAIPILLQYGLNSPREDSKDELEAERERELPKLETSYAKTRFKANQCFMINQAVTMRLHVLLSENRRLKKLCRAKGLIGKTAKDPWDSWGPSDLDSFYKRYVFVKSI